MMVTIANELHRRSHNVTLLVVEDAGPYRGDVADALPVVTLNGRNIVEMTRSLRLYLERNSADVVLSTLEIPNLAAVVATRYPISVPVVLRSASIYSRRTRLGKHRCIPIVKRLVYPRADEIVTISDGVAQDLAGVTGMDASEFTTIYNPAYSPKIRERAETPVDNEWLTDDSRDVVVSVGSLKPAKDFPTLIRALSRLRDRSDAHLIILGEGDERAKLDDLVTELGLEKRVSFPGFVRNPYSHLGRADVFALSSAWEGFGNVIVEAMGCGTPVVCTDCPGGPAEILNNGEYGPLVPVGDATAMAEAIQKMLDDPTNPDLLATRARDFSVEKIVDQYEELLLSVAN